MENTQIRKFSVGSGHPSQMMHYQVGKELTLNNKIYRITNIVLDRDLINLGKFGYNIYVKCEDVDSPILLWKTLIDVPMIIENNIAFD